MIVMLLGVALALEPPARPLPAPVVEGECSRARSVGPGDSVPCAGLLIGLSDSADLLATEVWAQQVADLYRITTTEQQHEIDLCAWQIEHLEAELVAASAPVPFLERPTTVLGVGVIGGMIVMISASWVLQAIHE